jgi:hypothetical protein
MRGGFFGIIISSAFSKMCRPAVVSKKSGGCGSGLSGSQQHFLYFLPEPHGHGEFRGIFTVGSYKTFKLSIFADNLLVLLAGHFVNR